VSAESYFDRDDQRNGLFSQLVHKISRGHRRRRTIRIVTDLVLRLPNVVTLRVYARSASAAPLYQPIFDAAWRSFGANLRTITLTGYVHHLPNPLLAPNVTPLPHLSLGFEYLNCCVMPHLSARFCNTLVAAFNRIGPTLESLCNFVSLLPSHTLITCLDLSDFFDHIDVLPHLKKLTVTALRLRDLRCLPLKYLLHDHAATLRHVSLKLDISGRTSSTYDDLPLLSFMTETIGSSSTSSLSSSCPSRLPLPRSSRCTLHAPQIPSPV
jgi:hypothetical protein